MCIAIPGFKVLFIQGLEAESLVIIVAMPIPDRAEQYALLVRFEVVQSAIILYVGAEIAVGIFYFGKGEVSTHLPICRNGPLII